MENAITQNSVLGKEEALEGEDENKGASRATRLGCIYISLLMATSRLSTHCAASSSGANTSDVQIHFGDEGKEDAPVDEKKHSEQTFDLFAEANQAEAAGQGMDENAESGDEGDMDPEDDFNAVWEVLEVARSLYKAQKDLDDKAKLKLADTYMALGDVSLETSVPPLLIC